MESEIVRIERCGPVTTVIIDRPAVRNAVDRATAEALGNAFLAFERDPDSHVAVLWGAGGNFCAGADLKAVAEGRGNRMRAPQSDDALDRLAKALDATLIAGVRTNVPFLANLCRVDAFRQGKVDTGFIDRNLAALGATPREPDWGAAARGAVHLLNAIAVMPQQEALHEEGAATEEYSPWSAHDGFQLGGRRTLADGLVRL